MCRDDLESVLLDSADARLTWGCADWVDVRDDDSVLVDLK